VAKNAVAATTTTMVTMPGHSQAQDLTTRTIPDVADVTVAMAAAAVLATTPTATVPVSAVRLPALSWLPQRQLLLPRL
jgi:hypothetical protein